jgi:pantoate--beta-alanine ligase
MEIVPNIAALRGALRPARRREAKVAFVPTMGALHEGHLLLMRQARAWAGDDGVVVVSVFVNPTQFGPHEDFARYPRDPDGDAAKCRSVGVDLLFMPDALEMYPDHPQPPKTSVHVAGLTDGLCGPWRPGHFDGVATVVVKLLCLVQPDAAFFGQTDYQQLAVVRRAARDLSMPVEVVGVPTVRDPDGLAMSSRNAYLSADERARALGLSRGLRAAQAACLAGERDAAALLALAHAHLQADGEQVRVEYVELVHPDTLAPLALVGPDGAVMAMAARVGRTRLIDNLRVDQP